MSQEASNETPNELTGHRAVAILPIPSAAAASNRLRLPMVVATQDRIHDQFWCKPAVVWLVGRYTAFSPEKHAPVFPAGRGRMTGRR